MLKAGCGTVYEQSNAEYGQWGKEQYMSAMEEAKSARRGMWKAGTNGETPAEYKRRYANSSPIPTSKGPGETDSTEPDASESPRRTWLSRIWRR
ncbi:putative endonuclease lcl3 [Pleurotus ostreatus]|nr:putative endonuclease lcl3 [Pleurotus ostreatus]